MSKILDLVIDEYNKKNEKREETNNENVLRITIDDLNELKYFHYIEQQKNKSINQVEQKRVIEIDL
jgi:hypothetical protein